VLKHFAGDLLATLAGQDQLQGEGSNNMHASARFKVALAVTIMVCAEAGQSISAEPASSGGQPELDLIAGVPFDITFKQLGAPMPPGPFSSWTADQQRSVPADLQKLCAGFWTLINGADGTPKSRLLPASLPGADEVQLVMDVCMVGHLPADWPERGARLQSATSILNRADQAGASLHLPAEVSR
jgi:hypothetical protein